MSLRNHIPNFLTLMNLFCGCVALVFALRGGLVITSAFIGAAALFDFSDGMAARLLNAKSAIGKDLDSLGDVVSFGVAPGFILFRFLEINGNPGELPVSGFNILPYFALLIPLFSALRLAKFNNDLRQSDSFIGLPTPASALLIASFPLILWQRMGFCPDQPGMAHSVLLNGWFLLALVAVMSFLLVSELPLFSLKFKNLRWKDNQLRMIFLISVLVLLAIFRFAGIPLAVLLYLVLSLADRYARG